eukprot:8993537-Pyramimonas_sp.AAC.1
MDRHKLPKDGRTTACKCHAASTHCEKIFETLSMVTGRCLSGCCAWRGSRKRCRFSGPPYSIRKRMCLGEWYVWCKRMMFGCFSLLRMVITWSMWLRYINSLMNVMPSVSITFTT